MKRKILFFIILVGFFAGLYFFILFNQKPKTLKVYFFDVGQGDAIFIKTPSGKTMLVDAGPGNDVLKPLSKHFLFKKKHIDITLATHPDADHVGGFTSILSMYDVGAFVESGFDHDTQTMNQIENMVSQKNIKHIIAREGTVVNLGDDINFNILAPNEAEMKRESNDASIVGKLVYGNTSFILTGDAPITTEIRLVKDYGSASSPQVNLKTDVLKLGHHGSRTSSAIEFLQTVKPTLALISAGKNNRYGHPHPEVLNRLNYLNIPYLSTIDKGTICLQSNGAVVTKCE